MRVLIGCEQSGIVREEFRKLGHNAWSCDLLPTEIPGQHIQGDVLDVAYWGCWDLAVFHPECTYLANSSNKHLYIGKKLTGGPDEERWEKMRQGAEFFNKLLNAPIPMICVENPIQHRHARALIPKYQQLIQPWQFNEPFQKATCLWLKGLPKLQPTGIVSRELRQQKCWKEGPGPERKKNRSRTYRGIAIALAEQFSAASL